MAVTATSVGELCVGGDWACAHGDLAALRAVAQQLAMRVPEPVRCALTAVADACYGDPDRAVTLWNQLKQRVCQSAEPTTAKDADRARSA